jgi:hypothetical protein
MKQTVKISDLRVKLSLAQAALDDKGLMDFTGNVVFHDKRLFTGNDKLVVIGPAPFDFDFSVNGKDLITVLEGGGENADFTLKEAHIQIKSGKMKAKLALADVGAPLSWMKESGLDKEMHWSDLPKDFLTALDWCKFSVSKDISIKPHTCLKVLNNKVLSTDSFRISRFVMEEDMGITALIPKEAVPILSSFPDATEFGVIGESWFCIRNPKTEMMCGVRLVIGDLPEKIESFFDKEGETIKLPEGLKELIKRSGKFVEGVSEESKVIDILIKKGEIKCKGIKSTGYFEQKNDLEYDGPDMGFLVVPALFEQILDKVQTVSLCENFLSFKVGPFNHLMVVNASSEKTEEED